jgi:hypothetical protein
MYEYNLWYNHSVLVAVRYTDQDGTLRDVLKLSTELLETCRGFK